MALDVLGLVDLITGFWLILGAFISGLIFYISNFAIEIVCILFLCGGLLSLFKKFTRVKLPDSKIS